jgi:hypothetical protein
MFDTEKLKQIGLSYFRAAATAVTALYMAGEHDPKKLAMAFVAGIVGPVLQALDTNSPEFGRKK